MIDPGRAHFAVSRAWRTVLGGSSLAANLSLSQAGCDCLRLLQFRLILQKALHCNVPLDIINEEMRHADIEAALLRPMPKALPDDPRPVVFLMPGLDDDEMRLALFRRTLAKRVRFILVDYPDWPEMLRAGWGFAELVDAAMTQVLHCRSGAPLLLTGYSFGGEVAFATASRLAALGHAVRWLGILDTDLTHVPQPFTGGFMDRLRHYTAEIVHDVRHNRLHKTVGLFLAKLARQGFGLRNAARMAPWWRPLLPLRTQFWFDRRTRSILRMEALWRWLDATDAGTLASPVTLFRSRLGRGASPPDLGWSVRCPALSIVQVPGDHHTLFDAPQRDLLCARFSEAIEL
jgi:thioesterase domain-containing protein